MSTAAYRVKVSKSNSNTNCCCCFVFSRFPEQKSERIHLKKGKYYYLEAYQKSDKLADCVSVAVELPSGHFEGPIKRVHLSWRLPGKGHHFSLILL